MSYEGSVCWSSLSVVSTASDSVPILHDWFLDPFGAWLEMWDSISLCRLLYFVSAPAQVPRSTPQWAILQGPHHRTLCRALTAVLSLRPVGGDLPFLLKDSASAGVRSIQLQKILHCDLFLKRLLEWCQLGWVLCFCRGREGGLKLFLCASTSCFPASFEKQTIASLYKNLQRAFWRQISLMYYLKVPTVQIPACQID